MSLGTILSILTIINIYFMCKKSILGPITGVFFQVPWLIFAYHTDKGLIPATLVLAGMFGYTWYSWRKKQQRDRL